MKRLTLRLTDFLLFLCPFLIFYPSFQYFFFQDDFLHLKTSLIQDFSGFLRFFKVPEDAIFYRPLSLQIYFFTTRVLFGLNPLAFRLISFLFFLLSIFLLRKIIKKITKDDLLSFAVAFLFGISSIHFISLFWICEFSVILGVFFLLLSLFYYPQKRALLFFILGLLSHELVVILPVLLFFYELILKKRKFKTLSPFFVLGLFYIVFRFLLFPIPLEDTYKVSFGKENLKALTWYLLWSFNLPEELKYQTLSTVIIRKEFIQSFLKDSIIWGVFLLIIFIFSFILPNFGRKKLNLAGKAGLFGVSWFFITVLLLILAPFHQYPMYLAYALPGFYFALMSWFFTSLESFKKRSKKIILAPLLACFFILSLTTVRFTEKTHWTVREANKAKGIIKKTKEHNLRELTEVIFLLPRDPELKAALNDQDAFKVYYKDTIRVFYGEEKDIKYDQGFKVIKLDEG